MHFEGATVENGVAVETLVEEKRFVEVVILRVPARGSRLGRVQTGMPWLALAASSTSEPLRGKGRRRSSLVNLEPSEAY